MNLLAWSTVGILIQRQFFFLTASTPAVPNCCCSKGSAPYWSNPPFLIFDIRALWRSVLSARAPECQKLEMVGYTSMAKCKALTGSAVKGLIFAVRYDRRAMSMTERTIHTRYMHYSLKSPPPLCCCCCEALASIERFVQVMLVELTSFQPTIQPACQWTAVSRTNGSGSIQRGQWHLSLIHI